MGKIELEIKPGDVFWGGDPGNPELFLILRPWESDRGGSYPPWWIVWSFRRHDVIGVDADTFIEILARC